MVHNREFTSLFRLIAPAGRDYAPNGVLQPLSLTWVCWTGWSFTGMNTGSHVLLVTSVIWQYPCEDLITTGRLFQVVGRFLNEVHTEKEVIAREQTSLCFEGPATGIPLTSIRIRSGARYRRVSGAWRLYEYPANAPVIPKSPRHAWPS